VLLVSSLLHAWGSAGTFTVLAELLPDEQRLAANTLVSSLTFAATIAGPAIAGVLVTSVSSALVLGLDALTYAYLAVLVVRTRLPASGHVSPVDRAAARGGLALLRSHPELLGLLTLTWFFNLLYGPVEVAPPLHVTDDLQAPGTLLGLYWMLFGIGAMLGGLAVGALRQLPRWPVTIGIVWWVSRSCRSGSTCRRASPSPASRSAARSTDPSWRSRSHSCRRSRHHSTWRRCSQPAARCSSPHRRSARRWADRSPRRWARGPRSVAQASPPWRSAPSRAFCCSSAEGTDQESRSAGHLSAARLGPTRPPG
jgi:hypothetical protein